MLNGQLCLRQVVRHPGAALINACLRYMRGLSANMAAHLDGKRLFKQTLGRFIIGIAIFLFGIALLVLYQTSGLPEASILLKELEHKQSRKSELIREQKQKQGNAKKDEQWIKDAEEELSQTRKDVSGVSAIRGPIEWPVIHSLRLATITKLEERIPLRKNGVADAHAQITKISEEIQRIDKELEILTTRTDQWAVRFYRKYDLAVRDYAPIAFVGILLFLVPLGRWVIRSLIWVGPARIAERLAPISFVNGGPMTLTMSESKISLEIEVGMNEEMWVTQSWLEQSSIPEGSSICIHPVASKSKWFMSFWNGLWLMDKIKPSVSNPHAETVRSKERHLVTLSTESNRDSKLCVVSLVEGEGLVVLPRHIVALLFPQEKTPTFSRHWKITSITAWLTGQLCYWRIMGPVKLVMHGCGGIRQHQIASTTEGQSITLERGNLIATCISTTIGLKRRGSCCKSVFGSDPVLAYKLGGSGSYLVEETSMQGKQRSGLFGWLEGVGEFLLKLVGF